MEIIEATDFISAKELANILGVHYITILRYIKDGKLPPYFQIGKGCKIRWRREDIEEWMNNRIKLSQSPQS